MRHYAHKDLFLNQSLTIDKPFQRGINYIFRRLVRENAGDD